MLTCFCSSFCSHQINRQKIKRKDLWKKQATGIREEIVLYIHRILELAHLCSQNLILPFVIETVATSGHSANEPLRFLPSLGRCLKINSLITIGSTE